MKTIIYSKDNPVSVKKVTDMKPRHPKFIFLELGETEAVKEAKADKTRILIELDAPMKAKNPIKAVAKPVAKKEAPKKEAKKPAAKKKPKAKKKK